jgi:ubiquinone/menaquinone biosynthesis C-methylase UbiE
LKYEFQDIHFQNILEIATGSGNAVKFLNNDNLYTGTDISAGLLRIAVKKFNQNKFKNAEFYIADASDFPFADNFFDLSFCNLSLNFFKNLDSFIMELKRTLKTGGIFLCSVPVPEKTKSHVKIRGKLYSEHKLKQLFGKYGFRFEKLHYENGALLYFKAQLIDEN